ncbi:uncharacterized protein F4807DRAFT_423436 [Annulohypoxylon truncatum]|uniref:uncharacterized protein n=1 Tax=Annulohypoxylon truncatum TaxID=327061 RepID=UPI002007B4E2|nr:uncharacterized protein F4807DRAFT_423436 [Annulohypoxylon truncatum]KAI1210444.1 hypothetical protein F4807DRAFT_423436 [Annulohypoxylon truncatum]
MQKILRRVATAERAVAKRHKKQMQARDKKGLSRQRVRRQQQLSAFGVDVKNAKMAIKDAWELGPLAPRSDVGIHAGTRGAIKETQYGVFGRPTPTQLEARCAWAGGTKFLSLAVDDRVVLMEGPDKGRIGKIMDIDPNKMEVFVDGLNKSNVAIDPDLRNRKQPVAMATELGITISRVRLVHPLKDPVTGVTRDVIINRIEPRSIAHDRYTGKRHWTRVVPGLNAVIPWPKKEPENLKDHAADTLRIDVEEKTFVPTLLRPPMPESLIDELRGKYSRFRTRHDPEYVARLEAEEQAKRDQKKAAEESMRTPLQELHRAEREKKKKKGKPRLTVEMLEKIGEVMARNMERQRNAQGALPEAGGSSSSGGGGDVGGDGEASTSAKAKTTEAETSPPPLETVSEETPPPPSS